MDLAVKTSESGQQRANSAIVADSDMPMTSQTLRNQQLALQNELREKMSEGDAAGVIRVRNLLNNFPDAIIAAEIKELREGIDKGSARLEEIKSDIEYAERIKGEKNAVLAERIKAVEEAGLAVERVNIILYQLDNEAENLRGSRRENKRRLNKFIEDAVTHSDNT